jgi:molybdopterin/thiamine biosynthesis adenylyltransferase
MTLLAHEVLLVPDEDYLVRESLRLRIASGGYVRFLKQAREEGALAIFFHTHPRGDPQPSPFDDDVDRQLEGTFQRWTGSPTYVSAVFGGTAESPTFVGRVFSPNTPRRRISKVRVIGQRWRIITAADSPAEQEVDATTFDRQVRAFGISGQRALAQLDVGVVGAGGTGSAVVEQLIRVGVRRVTVIDFDTLSESNVTRVHESKLEDVGKPKVQVLANAVQRISPSATVVQVHGNVTNEAVARSLRHCDVIFGCTDDHAGRSVLSRMAYWYLLPLLDTGFVISSNAGKITGAFGRVTTVMPGTACLICRSRVDPAMIRNEMMSTDERRRLAGEGYAPELGEAAPSVMPYTTLVASLAVNELFDRLFALGSLDPPSEVIVRLHDRKISQNSTPADDQHFCADSEIWGRGDEEPLLGRVWV